MLPLSDARRRLEACRAAIVVSRKQRAARSLRRQQQGCDEAQTNGWSALALGASCWQAARGAPGAMPPVDAGPVDSPRRRPRRRPDSFVSPPVLTGKIFRRQHAFSLSAGALADVIFEARRSPPGAARRHTRARHRPRLHDVAAFDSEVGPLVLTLVRRCRRPPRRTPAHATRSLASLARRLAPRRATRPARRPVRPRPSTIRARAGAPSSLIGPCSRARDHAVQPSGTVGHFVSIGLSGAIRASPFRSATCRSRSSARRVGARDPIWNLDDRRSASRGLSATQVYVGVVNEVIDTSCCPALAPSSALDAVPDRGRRSGSTPAHDADRSSTTGHDP